MTPSALFAKKGEERMEKQKITVTVAGKPYTLVSADPPEHVRRVAAYVDRTLSETASATKLPSAQAAVLTCFRMAEELLKAQDENRMLQRRLEERARGLEETRI
jgi:cell division protein ZapA